MHLNNKIKEPQTWILVKSGVASGLKGLNQVPLFIIIILIIKYTVLYMIFEVDLKKKKSIRLVPTGKYIKRPDLSACLIVASDF